MDVATDRDLFDFIESVDVKERKEDSLQTTQKRVEKEEERRIFGKVLPMHWIIGLSVYQMLKVIIQHLAIFRNRLKTRFEGSNWRDF